MAAKADFSNPSVREQIMDAIEARLAGMKKGLPTADPFAFTFGRVQRQPFNDSGRGEEFSVAAFDTTESKTANTYPVVRCRIQVAFQILVQVRKDENPTTKLNLAFAEIERLIKTDRTYGGLAIDTIVTGSNTDIEYMYDKVIEGTLFMEVEYRHHSNDPRIIVKT